MAFREITPENNLTLFNAAVTTLEKRTPSIMKMRAWPAAWRPHCRNLKNVPSATAKLMRLTRTFI